MPPSLPRLLSLRVENLATIQEAEFELSPGLNVLSGETGAGKTALTRALELLLGARGSSNAVRHGSEHAFVQAEWWLPEGWWSAHASQGLQELSEGEGGVSIARRYKAGRWRALVDGRIARLEEVRELSNLLLNFYGQHEAQELRDQRAHARLLDAYGDGEGARLRERYGEIRREAARLGRERKALLEWEDEEKLKLWRHYHAELSEAAVLEGEEDALRAQQIELRHTEARAGQLSRALHCLLGEEGAQSQLLEAGSLVGEARGSSLLAHAEAISELAGGLQAELDALPPLSAREQVESRLALLGELSRKHRCLPDELPARLEKLSGQLTRAEELPTRLSELRARETEAHARLSRTASQLSEWRTQAARELESQMSGLMEGLGLPGARLRVLLQPLEKEGRPAYGEQGREQVSLSFSANPGLPLLPLAEVASGGELSRVMLALLSCMAAPEVGTLVLDEPDAGLGGQTAHRVADRITALAEQRQVLLVSHLPQLAGRASRHLLVSKQVVEGVTFSSITRLEEREQRLAELARMGGHPPEDQDALRLMERMLR